MIDINVIRNDKAAVKAALEKRGYDADLDGILKLDEERRAVIGRTEALKAEKNKVSADVPGLKKAGENVEPVFARMRELGNEISANDEKLKAVEEKLRNELLCLPNMPDPDVVAGGKENNEIVKVFGKKPEFDFPIKNHVELCEGLKLIDYERGVKLAGNGSWLYTDRGAVIEWALLNYFIKTHLKDGYKFILPPHMLNYECGLGAGQFPKFEDDVYRIETADDAASRRFMLPTAETALVNIYRGEILASDELPKKLFAYTPCYRKEAGSYRAEERGMIRGHQFDKVEMVQVTKPEQSKAAFEELVGKACALVEGLGLHYRLSKLAAGDCSASMARTYDIEVWIPSMGIYKEVSSVSNANDYQARRNMTRYRAADGSIGYVHTLNGSGLATSRILPAIVEQFQQKDGSVRVPKVLQEFVGAEVIK
ncbi:MAG: serine--tRNA ligase [Clostridia bacterium]|jgi:seryl-tRNA synthetase|nr:serine--tRNA ligase [Clostridia bacterium]MCI9459711.1 serine--tRNA ligase [Clostridia bacterium]